MRSLESDRKITCFEPGFNIDPQLKVWHVLVIVNKFLLLKNVFGKIFHSTIHYNIYIFDKLHETYNGLNICKGDNSK